MSRLLPLILFLGACTAPAGSVPPRATVLFFITTDCPIANSFAPEINRMVVAYGPRGVAFERIYTDPTLTPDDVRRHSREYGFDSEDYCAPSEARIDTGHEFVRRHGVTVTPEAVVLGPDGSRVYRGRIDDRYLAPGKYRLTPTTHELRDALDAVLAGRPVAVAETKAAGCPVTE
jgi:hypothetical protein